jgi:hypothetical protein
MGPLITHYVRETSITVTAATTQSLRCVEKRNIHGIVLSGTVAAGTAATDANWAADVTDIHMTIGGRVIIDHLTPAILLAKYAFNHAKDGALANNGCIPILATPDFLPYRGSSKQFRWGMLKPNGDSAELNLWLTYAAGPLTITAIRPLLIVDEDDKTEMGMHIRTLQYPSFHATTTDQEITTLPRDSNAIGALAYWFGTAVGVISQFKVFQDNLTVYDTIPAAMFARELHRAGLTVQANWTVLPFLQNLDLSSMLPLKGRNKLVVTPTWTTAPNAYVILQDLVYNGIKEG